MCFTDSFQLEGQRSLHPFSPSPDKTKPPQCSMWLCLSAFLWFNLPDTCGFINSWPLVVWKLSLESHDNPKTPLAEATECLPTHRTLPPLGLYFTQLLFFLLLIPLVFLFVCLFVSILFVCLLMGWGFRKCNSVAMFLLIYLYFESHKSLC